MTKIPHRLYLTEDQMPQKWFNLRAAMPEQPDPLIHPGTLQPLGVDDLSPIFCEELARQELDGATEYVDIPEPVRDVYKMYRPSPLVRAYELEKALDTPAKIYYKFEGNNTSGSHKLNSAVAQAYYAKLQGLTGVTTETGAGQWGTALAEACSYFGLTCDVYMVKCSYEQKPFRKAVMGVFDAQVTASPSPTTDIGRKILAETPDTTGSLGCAISEAVEAALSSGGTKRYVLGSVLNQVLLHQSIIGLESKIAMEQLGEYPDVVVGCAGGGSNLGGLIAPFMADKLRGVKNPRIVAVEPAECAAISGGFIGQHGIAGIGPGFVPENYNPYVVDTVLTVTTADAERAAREVLFFDGIPACTSAGATLAAAVQLMGTGKAKRPLCVFAGRKMYE